MAWRLFPSTWQHWHNSPQTLLVADEPQKSGDVAEGVIIAFVALAVFAIGALILFSA